MPGRRAETKGMAGARDERLQAAAGTGPAAAAVGRGGVDGASGRARLVATNFVAAGVNGARAHADFDSKSAGRSQRQSIVTRVISTV